MEKYKSYLRFLILYISLFILVKYMHIPIELKSIPIIFLMAVLIYPLAEDWVWLIYKIVDKIKHNKMKRIVLVGSMNECYDYCKMNNLPINKCIFINEYRKSFGLSDLDYIIMRNAYLLHDFKEIVTNLDLHGCKQKKEK